MRYQLITIAFFALVGGMGCGSVESIANFGLSSPQMENKMERNNSLSQGTREPAGWSEREIIGGQGGAYVRKYFPETLYFNPEVVTDDQGRATVEITLADSITTWRVEVFASTKDGGLQGATFPLKVFQELFLHLDLPVQLTAGDEVTVPVTVYNYLKKKQSVKVSLDSDRWYRLLEKSSTKTVDIEPQGSKTVHFRVQAKRHGYHPLTARIEAGQFRDAVRRQVEVRPDGKKVEQSQSGQLSGTVQAEVVIPSKALVATPRVKVRIYPSLLPQIMEGLESTLAVPRGCFEQTSSTSYPNALAVRYLQNMNDVPSKKLGRYKDYLSAGYQKVLSFQRPSGGFDWWGRGEAHVWLSAYGLMQLVDLSKVYPVDEAVVQRIRNYLLQRQTKGGSWDNFGKTHGENMTRLDNGEMALTAYVTWALIHSGVESEAVSKSVDYLVKNLDKVSQSPYVLALIANVLAQIEPKSTRLDQIFVWLAKLEQREGKHSFWSSKKQTLSHAGGGSAQQEITALVALASLKARRNMNLINRSVSYLASRRRGGRWQTTQATVLALKVMVQLAAANPSAQGKNDIDIAVNGQVVQSLKIDDKNRDLLHQVDLSSYVQVGANQVSIRSKDKVNIPYEIETGYYVPHQSESGKSPLELTVVYDKNQVKVGEVTAVQARVVSHRSQPTHMVTMRLALPPGFKLVKADLEQQVGRQIARYEVNQREVVIYLNRIEKREPAQITYRLKALYPAKVKAPRSTAYVYYSPQICSYTEPVSLEVVR